jgi:hypothetical protein
MAPRSPIKNMTTFFPCYFTLNHPELFKLFFRVFQRDSLTLIKVFYDSSLLENSALHTVDHDLLLAVTRRDLPNLVWPFPPRPRPRPLPRTLPLRPLCADVSKSSVDERVFCFSLFPWPPNPNFLSRTCRGKLPALPPRARFAGRRSAMASSTATSKASWSSACALCNAPLCSFYRYRN